jgi:multidrug resistance efflux pump
VAAEQNRTAASKTVESDETDLELAKVEFSRADNLTQKGAGTIEPRDQANAVS